MAADSKKDSTQDPAFQRVVQTFLNTPPQHKSAKPKGHSDASERLEKAAKAGDPAKPKASPSSVRFPRKG